MEQLSDQYIRTKSGVARWSGGLIYVSVALFFDAPLAFTIDLHTDTPHLRQGVALRFMRRKGRIAGYLSERFVLWEDTAPFPVPAEYVAKRSPFQLIVWNVWEGPHGATMAGVANAGVIIEDQGPGLLQLGCSAGPGEVRPADARVRLKWPDDIAARIETPTPPSG